MTASKPPLKGVWIAGTNDAGDLEHYWERKETPEIRIEWSRIRGSAEWVDTILVLINGKPHVEAPASSCVMWWYAD